MNLKPSGFPTSPTAASGSLNQFLPSVMSGKACHHSQQWQTETYLTAVCVHLALKHICLLCSPLLQPLSWHPRSCEALPQSHRMTGALPPVHAACHQTRLWVPLQDRNVLMKKNRQPITTNLLTKTRLCSEISYQHQPRGWILLTKNISINAITANKKLSVSDTAAQIHSTHQRNSRCVRRWCTCWRDI